MRIQLEAPPANDPSKDTVELHPVRHLWLEAFGHTDTGRVRDHNEDQFVVAELTKAIRIEQGSVDPPGLRISPDRCRLFIVADGMGGHAAGEQASAMVLQSIQDFALDTLKWFLEMEGEEGKELIRELQQALQQADSDIIAEAVRRPELRGMGSTVTLGYVRNDELFVAHAGDSRCYLFREGKLHQMTHDHTLVQDLIRRGGLPPEAAQTHRLRHVITNVVGGPRPGVQVEVMKARLNPGDRLLFCSDGLSGMVSDEEMADILGHGDDMEAVCMELIAKANDAGGKDNITAIVVRVGEPRG